MKKILGTVLAFVLLLLLAGCAAGGNEHIGQTRTGQEEPANFLTGIWHGFITPVSFIVSLFDSNVNVYEPYNIGGFYNLGFLIGISCTFGGSAGAGSHGRRKRRHKADSYEE